MILEDIKSIEYKFDDHVFILYINGKEKWKITRSEFADEKVFYVISIKIDDEQVGYLFYPRFLSETVKIFGPLEWNQNEKKYGVLKEKVDWIISLKKIETKFSIKEKGVLDKDIDRHKKIISDYKDKIKEFEKIIREHEEILKLLEKLKGDNKWQ